MKLRNITPNKNRIQKDCKEKTETTQKRNTQIMKRNKTNKSKKENKQTFKDKAM
jgi:hypothetical protein